MTERRVEVVYCDDIRAEIGNKSSLMGVYAGDLFVKHIPFTLAKLCAWVNVVSAGDSPVGSLRVRMEQEGGAVVIDTGDVPLPDAPPEEGDDVPTFIAYNFALVLSPYQIDRETSLRVVATADGVELPSRRLRIRRVDGATAPPPPGE